MGNINLKFIKKEGNMKYLVICLIFSAALCFESVENRNLGYNCYQNTVDEQVLDRLYDHSLSNDQLRGFKWYVDCLLKNKKEFIDSHHWTGEIEAIQHEIAEQQKSRNLSEK